MQTAIAPDGYFLSTQNPLATSDQRDVEALALQVMQHEAVSRAREAATFMWRAAVGDDADEGAWSLFEAAMKEYVFNCVLKAVNSDASHPRIIRFIAPEHRWFGMTVSGSRAAGDSPDHVYRLAPIESGATYELRGKRASSKSSDFSFAVHANTVLSKGLATVDGRKIRVGEDGSFVLTLGPNATDADSNYLHVGQGAKYLLIRDCLADWREVPNALRLVRLSSPSAAPIAIEQMASRAAESIVDDVPGTYWFMRMALSARPNSAKTPFVTGRVGGLATQMIMFGRAALTQDTAVVVTLDPGDAEYRGMQVLDYWFRSVDYATRTGSLNRNQSATNADGTVTYVIATSDPGIHNWIDTSGLHHVSFVHRWQGLSGSQFVPAYRVEVVKMEELHRRLPVGTKLVNPQERREQINERGVQVASRYLDH